MTAADMGLARRRVERAEAALEAAREACTRPVDTSTPEGRHEVYVVTLRLHEAERELKEAREAEHARAAYASVERAQDELDDARRAFAAAARRLREAEHEFERAWAATAGEGGP